MAWLKDSNIQSAVIGAVSAILATILGVWLTQTSDTSKKPIDLDPFPKNQASILIFPFDKLSECNDQNSDGAMALSKRIAILTDSAQSRVLTAVWTNHNCPATLEEARRLGQNLKADIVVWGDYFEHCNSDTNTYCLNYAMVDTSMDHVTGTTGLQRATIEEIYAGKAMTGLEAAALFFAGIAQFQQDNPAESSKLLLQALVRSDTTAVDLRKYAYYYLGAIKYHEGKYGECIDLFKKSVMLDPGFVRPYIGLGNAYQMNGQDHLGDSCYWEVVKHISPTTSSPYDRVILAAAYSNLGIVDSGMNHIQYAIARIGSNTNARLNYATLLGLRGEYRDALAQVNIVLKAAPRNWEARMTRLRIVAQLVNETTEEVDFNTLLDDLRFFVTTDSSNMNWRAQLASAYNNLEKYDSALVEIQVVIAHDSSNVFAHTIRGLAYYGLDSLLQARADLQWHIAESEMPAFNYFYLAAVAAKLRDDVSGLKDLKMAMKYGVRDVISKDEMLRNFKTLPPGRYVLYKRVIDSDV